MSKHKTNRKWGRNKIKCAEYKARHLRELHAYKRVKQSQGDKAAVRYAQQAGIENLVKRTPANRIANVHLL